MHLGILEQIEGMINRLSREEQLWLIELLAHRLREESIGIENSHKDKLESQLVAMASDPEIQAELQEINREFVVTEADGLEND